MTDFITAFTPNSPRNDQTLWVGFRFVVGADPVAVTALGRAVVSGNTGAHAVQIVRASDGAVMASATVATSGGTAGQFAWANLGSPVTLAASTAYFIASQETAGGDTWNEFATDPQTTSAASITNAAYSTDGTTFNLGSAGAYVPPNFRYGGNPKAHTLTDDFDDGTIDTAKWDVVGPPSESGGKAVVPPSATVGGVWQSKLSSDARYDLVASAVAVEVPQIATASGSVPSAWTRLNLTDDTGTNATAELLVVVDSGGGTITFGVDFASTTDDLTAITYDATAHRWWRIRESGGTTYWETSPDGGTWTVRKSRANPADVGSLFAELVAYRVPASVQGQNALFDNFNLVRTPATASGSAATTGGAVLTRVNYASAAGSASSAGAAAATLLKPAVRDLAGNLAGSYADQPVTNLSPATWQVTASGSASTAGTGGGVSLLIRSTASGSGPTSGSAAIALARQAAAAGTATTTGSAALSAATGASASGSASTAGSAATTTGLGATATGGAATVGAAAVTLLLNASASGFGSSGGSAGLEETGIDPVTADGSAASAGSAAVTVDLVLSAAGAATTNGLGSISALLSASAAGAATTNGLGSIATLEETGAAGFAVTDGTAVVAIGLCSTAEGSATTSGTADVRATLGVRASALAATEGTAEIGIGYRIYASGETTTTGQGTAQITVELISAAGASSSSGSASALVSQFAGTVSYHDAPARVLLTDALPL